MRHSTTTTALMAIVVCACSTFEDARYPSSQGWRTGKIQSLAASTTPLPFGAIDCRAQAIETPPTATAFAYVQFDFRPSPKYFGSNPTQRHIIARVAPGAHVTRGEHVRVNVKDCSEPVVPLENAS